MQVQKRLQFACGCIVAIALVSCGGLGQVEQGLVVDYDAATGVMTVVTDSTLGGPEGPRYDAMPAKTVHVPEDSSQMGPLPEAGGLLAIDAAGATAVVYDRAAGALRTVPFTLVELTDNVFADDPRVGHAELPKVDPSSGAVTFYSPRTRQILTINLPAEYRSLESECWRSGDEVRYYFKDPTQALRVMNISKTTVS